MNIEGIRNIGDMVYFLHRSYTAKCPVCFGTKKITLNSVNENDEIISAREYVCPECSGNGIISIKENAKYEVCVGFIKEAQLKISETKCIVTYSITCEDVEVKRAMKDSELFSDRESANNYCRIKNLERRTVPLNFIKIPSFFADSIPRNEKLMKRVDEWRKNKRMTTEIYVDESADGILTLFDGYTSYLVYKMFGIENVPVVIFPDENKNLPH